MINNYLNKKEMKSLINKILACLVVSCFVACNDTDIFNKELYKKVVYVLSYENQAYPVVHSLNEPESIGYLTVYAGGSTSIDQDVVVTFEHDDELLLKYNLSNYDLDTSKYAVELDASRYSLESYTTTLKKGAQDAYSLLPIKIRPEGLSPDSIYLIPLKIKNVSNYELNPERSNVLYRVVLENDYAEQKNATYYFMKGERKTEGQEMSVKIAGNKKVKPLTKNRIRVFAALENGNNKDELDLINKYSMILQVNSDQSVSIFPYKEDLIQVEQLGGSADNKYLFEYGFKRFYIHYKYRTLNSPATATEEAKWNKWIEVSENMKRLE